MNTSTNIALVTGASRGIGKAITLQLAQQGMAVVGTATSQAGADNITQYLEAGGYTGQGMVLDITDQTSIDKLLEQMTQAFGDPNVLVNNAGITRDNIMLRMKPDEWDDIINTNLNSVYRLSKSLLKPMVKNRWGRIINITSVVGLTGNAGQANYAAAKAGLIGFSKSLAQEVASRGITVNCVAPGFIDTDMTRKLSEKQQELITSQIPMSRMGQPDDIAAAVAFLASQQANYITGHTLHVNGGMYMA
ncbi:MAG: 3-oxoacyl-ACP reductase FabG [Gammaproteobacteria bacterium]